MTNKEMKIRELSDKIDAFQYDANPYEYMDVCSTIEEISANLDRMGNKFTVCYIVPLEDGTHNYTSKRFDNLADALSVYQTFIEYFAKGLYSVTDRKNLLK